MKIIMTKDEAKDYLAKAFQDVLPPNGMKVASVEWTPYSADVTVVLEKQDPPSEFRHHYGVPLPPDYVPKKPDEEPL